jgi:hypothetical protein
MCNYQISPLQKKKAVEIHNKLALCFSDDAYPLASVHHWVHELKTRRISTKTICRPGRLPLDDIDAAILKQLLEAPFSSLRTLSEDLYISRVTVWEYMNKSFGL